MADEAATAAEPTSVLGGGEAAPAEAPAEAPTEPAQDPVAAPEASEGEKPAEDEGDEKPEGAPEAYEWQTPEGWKGELDQAALDALEPVARELGLTNEQANKLVAVQANHLKAQQQAAQEQHAATMEQWSNDLKNDPDFGGAKFDANVKVAQKAFEAFGSPELKQLLNESGLGSHPELVKAFHKIGLKISEDTMESGSGGSGQRSAAEILYPNQSAKQ